MLPSSRTPSNPDLTKPLLPEKSDPSDSCTTDKGTRYIIMPAAKPAGEFKNPPSIRGSELLMPAVYEPPEPSGVIIPITPPPKNPTEPSRFDRLERNDVTPEIKQNKAWFVFLTCCLLLCRMLGSLSASSVISEVGGADVEVIAFTVLIKVLLVLFSNTESTYRKLANPAGSSKELTFETNKLIKLVGQHNQDSETQIDLSTLGTLTTTYTLKLELSFSLKASTFATFLSSSSGKGFSAANVVPALLTFLPKAPASKAVPAVLAMGGLIWTLFSRELQEAKYNHSVEVTLKSEFPEDFKIWKGTHPDFLWLSKASTHSKVQKSSYWSFSGLFSGHFTAKTTTQIADYAHLHSPTGKLASSILGYLIGLLSVPFSDKSRCKNRDQQEHGRASKMIPAAFIMRHHIKDLESKVTDHPELKAELQAAKEAWVKIWTELKQADAVNSKPKTIFSRIGLAVAFLGFMTDSASWSLTFAKPFTEVLTPLFNLSDGARKNLFRSSAAIALPFATYAAYTPFSFKKGKAEKGADMVGKKASCHKEPKPRAPFAHLTGTGD